MTALAMNGLAGVSFLIEEALLPLTVEALGPLMSGASAANPSPSASTTTAPRKRRDTKRIGDISEARVLAALTEAGYVVSKPFGENARYDLVADDGARLLRVQVKTGRLRNGVVLFKCNSSHFHRGGKDRPYFGEIEYLAVYCPETGRVYWVPEQELTASTAHLRLSSPRNNMVKKIRWASEFELP